jgi:hypothetical protein
MALLVWLYDPWILLWVRPSDQFIALWVWSRLHLWNYEWEEMIRLTSYVRADDRFMTLRVRQDDQFMKVWTKPSILLLHHNYPFIENICEVKCIIWDRFQDIIWVRPAAPSMELRVRTSAEDITKCVIPFTTLWVRSSDEFMAIWIRPYAKIMAQ